jgi:hypothetical protein
MADSFWIHAVQAAGGLHLVTLALAIRTPIPPDWEDNLAKLPPVHRRFALVQNAYIGLAIAALGLLSLFCAPELVSGTPLPRAVCGGIALFWGGRGALLPWLDVRPWLTTVWLKLGYACLTAECAGFALLFGWLAVRPS